MSTVAAGWADTKWLFLFVLRPVRPLCLDRLCQLLMFPPTPHLPFLLEAWLLNLHLSLVCSIQSCNNTLTIWPVFCFWVRPNKLREQRRVALLCARMFLPVCPLVCVWSACFPGSYSLVPSLFPPILLSLQSVRSRITCSSPHLWVVRFGFLPVLLSASSSLVWTFIQSLLHFSVQYLDTNRVPSLKNFFLSNWWLMFLFFYWLWLSPEGLCVCFSHCLHWPFFHPDVHQCDVHLQHRMSHDQNITHTLHLLTHRNLHCKNNVCFT